MIVSCTIIYTRALGAWDLVGRLRWLVVLIKLRMQDNLRTRACASTISAGGLHKLITHGAQVLNAASADALALLLIKWHTHTLLV